MRALIYSRKSSDPKGTGRSVAEQEAACRAVCERHGWEVVGALVDNNRSGSRYAKTSRAAWAEVKRRIAKRECDVLVTFEASRQQRDLAGYVELRDLCRAHNVSWAYDGNIYDPQSDGFRTGLDALLAEEESERTRTRILRTVASNAAKGRPHGPVLYGYKRVYDQQTGALLRQEPEPAEAKIIVEAAKRFLAGESARSIANDFNRRQVPSPRSGEWDLTRVRRILTNPGYAGRRVHQGKVVGAADWPPILDTATFDRLAGRFADPSRHLRRQTTTAHLLSGVARCGRCGATVIYGKDRNGRRVYTCRKFHTTRDGVRLDAFISGVVLERLARPDALAALEATETPEIAAAASEAAELRARLDAAIAEFTGGHLTAVTLAKIEADLLARIDAAERRARVAGLPTIAVGIASADDVDAAWDALSGEQRRELVRALVEVVVLPGRPGVRGFQADTIRVEFLR